MKTDSTTRFLCMILSVALGLSCCTVTVHATTITGWDFEDGTLQGWTMASTSTIGPTGYAATGKTDEPPLPETFWDPLGYNSKTPGFGFAAAPSPFADRALAQDAPLVLRSPTFELNSGGQIIAHLLGGIPGEVAVPPSNFSALSGPSISTSGSDASYQGLALRRNSDGEYLLRKARTSTSSSYTGWQQVTFSEAELAGVIASNPGQLFTLDLIDTAHGTFSSLNLDTVSIPASTGNSLVSGGGQWQVLKRNSAAAVSNLAAADALLALPSGSAGITSENQGTTSLINYHGSGATGHFGQDNPYLGGTADNFAQRITGQINVLQTGAITFGFFANDGGRLRIDGTLVAQDDFADLAADTLGTINLTAGLHDLELVMFESTGADTVELYVATSLGVFTSLSQTSFELLTATSIPEPAGCALAGFGLLVMGLFGGRSNRH